MTINYVYEKINKIMECLDRIDFFDVSSNQRKYNQKKINEVYNILDNLNDEIIREIEIKKRIKKERKKIKC